MAALTTISILYILPLTILLYMIIRSMISKDFSEKSEIKSKGEMLLLTISSFIPVWNLIIILVSFDDIMKLIFGNLFSKFTDWFDEPFHKEND